jgi:hypothetical protein
MNTSVHSIVNLHIPWYFDIPAPEDAVAWKQIKDTQGFAAKYGLTTAERRSSRFRFPSDDQCQWNGPMWGFSTTQTLIAMANILNQQQQPYVDQRDYLRMFSIYVASHRLRLASGKTIPWVDEAMDAAPTMITPDLRIP